MAAQILAMRRQRKGVHASKPHGKKAYVPPKVVDQTPTKGHFIAHKIGNKVRGGERAREMVGGGKGRGGVGKEKLPGEKTWRDSADAREALGFECINPRR